jgi:choline-sulfatase
MWRKIAIAIFPAIALCSSTPVILISVDTLRADHLGCYGYKKIHTPHFDSLAKGGTVFSAVDSPVPMTLPAHTSLLTSQYPFVHGVEENGQAVPAGAVTLAGVLKSHGYQTAAFIGGYVLDASFGLNQGFDYYDSPFRIRPQRGEDAPELKRTAEDVLRGAIEWLSTHSDSFFVFIHLYDLHQPYSHGYDAQVSYVDEQLGRLWSFLEAKGLARKTLIAVTSDHGESLGEHGENTHGYFIYQSTLWTPLLIHWPAGMRPPAARIDAPASLIDVAPTILQSLEIPAPPQFQGRNLLRPGEESVYSESMYAHDHLGCSPLRSLRAGSYKYIQAPKPELYDLSKDPAEAHNLYDQQKTLAKNLQERLRSLLSRPEVKAAPMTASPEVVARLRSLGYLAGRSVRAIDGSGPDPKDRLDEYLRYGRAILYSSTGRLPEATQEFQEVLKQDGQNVLAHFYLAVCYHRLRRLDDSAKELDATLAIAPDYWRAEELLGSIWLEKKDYVRAREQFTHLLKGVPGDYGAHFNLGILATRDGKWDEARRHLQAALAADPDSADARRALEKLPEVRQ